MTRNRQAELIYKDKGHLLKISHLRMIATAQSTHELQEKDQKSKAQKDICELSRI